MITFRNVRRSGAAGLAVTAVLAAATFSVGGLRIFDRSYTIAAVFDEAAGIETGDPVRVAGVNVGDVTRVEREPRSGTVRMTLRLDRGVVVSDRARASVRLRTLLGKKYVDLADVGRGEPLSAGAVIPRSRTDSGTDVDTLLNAAEPVVERTDVGSLNRLAGSLDRALAGRGDDIRSLVTDLDRLAGVLADRRADIDRLIGAADTLGAAVDGRREALASTVDGFARILDALAARRAEVSDLVAGVQRLSARLTPLLGRNQQQLDAVVGNLVETSKVLDAQRARIDLALTHIPRVTDRFMATTSQGSWVNVYIVGIVATPFLSNPVNLGDSYGLEPGEAGGLPRLWVRPPAQLPGTSVAGVDVNTGDDRSIEPPEGYPGS